MSEPVNTIDNPLKHVPLLRMARLALAIFVCMSIAIAGQVACSQDPATYTPEDLRKHFHSAAQAMEMRCGGVRLELRPQPLMHWQNTVRQQERGAIYMWEKNGRPQVLSSIFTFENDGQVRCRHEMISIADSALTCKLDSVAVWTPKQAGVKWNHCDGVAAPSESASRRLIQMRAIARQFSGTLNIPDLQPANLKLIPQPLVRYQDPEAGVIDGAVFSMAVVTDPEILLVIEARSSENISNTWQFAAARSHYHELELKRMDQLVWAAPMVSELANTKAGQNPWASEPYFIFFPPNPLPAPEDLR